MRADGVLIFGSPGALCRRNSLVLAVEWLVFRCGPAEVPAGPSLSPTAAGGGPGQPTAAALSAGVFKMQASAQHCPHTWPCPIRLSTPPPHHHSPLPITVRFGPRCCDVPACCSPIDQRLPCRPQRWSKGDVMDPGAITATAVHATSPPPPPAQKLAPPPLPSTPPPVIRRRPGGGGWATEPAPPPERE